MARTWRASALSWCTLVGSLSDDPIETAYIYDLRQTKATRASESKAPNTEEEKMVMLVGDPKPIHLID